MTTQPFCGSAESRGAPLHFVTAAVSSGPCEDDKRLGVSQETPHASLCRAESRRERVWSWCYTLYQPPLCLKISCNWLRRLVQKRIHFLSWFFTSCLQLFTSKHCLSAFRSQEQSFAPAIFFKPSSLYSTLPIECTTLS